MIDLLYRLIRIGFEVYNLAILVRIILSWIPHNPYNFIISFIYDITEPFLNIFRRIFPPRPTFPLDFSPILAIIALQVIEFIVIKLFLFIF